MIEFVLPRSAGEWMAWSGAVYLVLGGLFRFLVPFLWVRYRNVRIMEGDSAIKSALRGPLGAGNLGLGLAVMLLHPQPLLYLALGAMFMFMAGGRLLSFVLDGGISGKSVLIFLIEGMFAAFCLFYAFGITA